MKHKGSCHCGNVAFEVEGDIDRALACNCSMCQRKGSLLWFTPRENLNKHAIRHRFCATCGIHPYAEAIDPKGNPTAAINIRCIEGIDLDAIPVKHFDGRAL